MKKVLIFIIFLFIPIIINASSINKIYIDSEVDISGNLIVKEIVDAEYINSPINIYYRNEIDEIYKGTTILLRKVGILDDIKNINEFYYNDFVSKHVTEIDNYEQLDDGKYLNLFFDHRDVYYIEYIILNLGVKHNDAAELWYRYLYNFKHDIKECNITLRLPSKSELFDVYVHSDSNVKVTKDIEKSIVSLNIKNFKSSNYLDVRLLYDKDIFSFNINKNKYSNTNILNIVKKQEHSIFNYIYILYILIVLFILCLISIIYSHIKIDVCNYNICSKKIDKNIKILVLSDIHDRDINKKIIKVVNNEKPDYVVISGDAIDGKYLTKRIANKKINIFLKLCNMLKDYKVYYTYGNHETYLTSERYKRFKNQVLETKINILNNKGVYLSDHIKLSGIFHENKYYNRKKYPMNDEYIKSKIGNIDKKEFNIIVCHNPLVPNPFKKYGFDMMISGHVHGGIARIPWALLSPEYRFFPKYSSGLYNIDNMKLLVSRGIGYSKTLPFRINNPAHIMIINLSKEE